MQFIQPKWAAPAHIHAYSTTRCGGVSVNEFKGLNLGGHVKDDPKHVSTNRQILVEQFPNSHDFCWLNQVHGCELIKLTSNTPDNLNADASWSDSNQRTCVVMTADCLPVLVTDKAGLFVAAIHAGWRGLYDGIIEKSIDKICAELKVEAHNLLVWLGPCIGPTAFEVGDEVRTLFISENSQSDAAFVAHNDKWLANLHQLAKLRLARFKGITITESELCTYNDPALFYSYRRDGQTGRLATFIWID
ncbi:peptidoglycan editing factor PgeF [Psychromonas aquatilis]|uniref:Purine nucleoside phosphorylase n=1 Tax=Psychromonas aquatilis TaxID=2005072 RepID=A0ABU9GP43_9GAMM